MLADSSGRTPSIFMMATLCGTFGVHTFRPPFDLPPLSCICLVAEINFNQTNKVCSIEVIYVVI